MIELTRNYRASAQRVRNCTGCEMGGIMNYWLLIFALILGTQKQAFGDSTVVIKIIEERQKNRESSRFSLLEWLKIKERMKEMDLWLALTTEPKSSFSPEFNLGYFTLDQDLVTPYDKILTNEKSYSAEGTIWLTNLFSGTLGIRSLNIDFGVEARKSALQWKENGLSLDDLKEGGSYDRFACFRLFGRHSQDSSVELRYGAHSGSVLVPTATGYTQPEFSGPAYGGAVQLYLGNWLGFSAEKMFLTSENSLTVNSTANSRWGAFIEISILRFEYQITREEIYLKGESLDPRFGKRFGLSLHL